MRHVAFGQPLEAVVDADNLQALLDRLERDRTDHAVDARRRPSADDHCKLFPHNPLPLLKATLVRNASMPFNTAQNVSKQCRIVNPKEAFERGASSRAPVADEHPSLTRRPHVLRPFPFLLSFPLLRC